MDKSAETGKRGKYGDREDPGHKRAIEWAERTSMRTAKS